MVLQETMLSISSAEAEYVFAGKHANKLMMITSSRSYDIKLADITGSSEGSGMVNSESGKIDFGGEMKVNRALALFLFCVCTVSPFGLT
ncbi:hypothetical protein Tco_0111860, partial [Tanacetum coccineum]